MKGDFDDLTWAFVQIAIVLVFVIWAINPMFKSIELAQQNSARLNAQEIAGVINIMKTGASDMTYKTALPPVACTVEINEKFVKFDIFTGGRHQVVIMDIVQTPVRVISAKPSYDCKEKTIQIAKEGGIIRVDRATVS